LTPASGRADHTADTGRFDPGLARDRTALAWTRSALSMLAIGTLIARAAFNEHLDVLGALTALVTAALGLLTWRYGRVLYRDRAVAGSEPHHQPGALGFLMLAALAAAVVALVVTIVL
jgi:uncharacterized membrane protein YidH (DUF202 family)